MLNIAETVSLGFICLHIRMFCATPSFRPNVVHNPECCAAAQAEGCQRIPSAYRPLLMLAYGLPTMHAQHGLSQLNLLIHHGKTRRWLLSVVAPSQGMPACITVPSPNPSTPKLGKGLNTDRAVTACVPACIRDQGELAGLSGESASSSSSSVAAAALGVRGLLHTWRPQQRNQYSSAFMPPGLALTLACSSGSSHTSIAHLQATRCRF